MSAYAYLTTAKQVRDDTAGYSDRIHNAKTLNELNTAITNWSEESRIFNVPQLNDLLQKFDDYKNKFGGIQPTQGMIDELAARQEYEAQLADAKLYAVTRTQEFLTASQKALQTSVEQVTTEVSGLSDDVGTLGGVVSVLVDASTLSEADKQGLRDQLGGIVAGRKDAAQRIKNILADVALQKKNLDAGVLPVSNVPAAVIPDAPAAGLGVKALWVGGLLGFLGLLLYLSKGGRR